jgi:hypothetical protein
MGGKKYDVKLLLLLFKIKGVIYGQPKDFNLHNNIICKNVPTAIPKKPAIYPNKIYINLHILMVKFNDKSGMLNEQIAVIATIIISMGLTRLALTAASPNIKPPTILIVGPIGDGTLTPASLINSKDISIKSISKITGNGTVSLAASIVNNSSVGKSS